MRYRPGPDIDGRIREELTDVGEALQNLDVESIQLAQLNAAPAKYTDGMTVYADGTNWDPGSGEGVYTYYNSTWNYLG